GAGRDAGQLEARRGRRRRHLGVGRRCEEEISVGDPRPAALSALREAAADELKLKTLQSRNGAGREVGPVFFGARGYMPRRFFASSTIDRSDCFFTSIVPGVRPISARSSMFFCKSATSKEASIER